MMIKVTCAIIIKHNKILVTQRKASSTHPLGWEFPGGKLNPGESIEDCIVREIKEELDLEIEIQEALISVCYNYGRKQIELIPFLCTIKIGKIKLIEHQSFMWINFNNLFDFDFICADRKMLQLPENKSILEKYLRKNMHNAR
jgi:8-oxo-dGTP diphosphatase